MLEYVFCTLMPDEQSHARLVATALNVYRSAMEKFPAALALRFNLVRAAFHFGTEPDIEYASRVARETLDKDQAALTLDPLDDVMTWDYCQGFFNYRSYLQIVTEALCDGADRGAELKALIWTDIFLLMTPRGSPRSPIIFLKENNRFRRLRQARYIFHWAMLNKL